MKELKRTWIHLLLLAAAALVAYVEAQPKDASDKPLQPGETELWKAKPDDVSKIAFEDDSKRVTLERKSDKNGFWYAGQVEPIDKPKDAADKPKDPHAFPPPHVDPATFESVTVAKDLVKSLCALRAKRSFGQIGDDRLKEFGFDKPEGTLRVTVAGVLHVLLIGGATAGASTRYARDEQSKVVYVIDSTPVSDLKAGTIRLTERNQHEWKWGEPDSISVVGGGKQKRVVHSGTEGHRFWADANSADQIDETSGNWLSKVERLRPDKFLDKLPDGATQIVRVEYRAGSDEKGFFELYHRDDKEAPYLIVTEALRLPAVVQKQSAAQVLSDLASVLPGAELPKYGDEPAPPPSLAAPPVTSATAASSAKSAASAAPSGKPSKTPGPPHPQKL